MTLLADTARMEDTAGDMRRLITDIDLQRTFRDVEVGDAAASLQLATLSNKAGAFLDAMTPQVAAIANAITLGADDAATADHTDVGAGQ